MESNLEQTQPGGPPPEGPECEWKERLPRPQRIARTLAAFANGKGGALWVGVRDDGRQVGVGRPDEVLAELRRIASACLTPSQPIHVESIEHESLTLVRATIGEAADRPVLAEGRDGAWTAFVRDGASTRRAHRATLRAWSRSRGTGQLDSKARRLLREIKGRARFDEAGATTSELARLARMGPRSAKRLVVQLEQRGLVTDRGGGRFGLTPEGHRRA